MNVDEKLLKVLVALQLDPEADLKALQKRLKLKEHNIRYALSKARDLGLFRRASFINLFALGYIQHHIYFSLPSESLTAREALLEEMINSELTSWIGKLGGDYNFGANVCARNISEIYQFLEKLSQKYGNLFRDKAFATRLSLHYFGNRYLYPKLSSEITLKYRIDSPLTKIDELDHKLLSALCNVDYDSVRHLAKQLGISQSTADYRLKNLKEKGVIVSNYYDIDSNKLGINSYLFLVCTKGISGSLLQKFLDFCSEEPSIVVLIQSIGSWDFELAIDTFTPEQAVQLYEKIGEKFQSHLHWIKMLPLFSTLKIKEYPMINLK